jgi:hypothetical protein
VVNAFYNPNKNDIGKNPQNVLEQRQAIFELNLPSESFSKKKKLSYYSFSRRHLAAVIL